MERGTNISRGLANIVPVTTFWNNKTVDLGEQGRISVTIDLQGFDLLFIPDVRNALKEQKWEDIAFPVRPIDGRTSECIGSLPQR